MTEAATDPEVAANAETTEAWDGPLFERFVRFREAITPGLNAQGFAALELYPPAPGEHVLDVGCGWGDTTRQIASMVGPGGEVVGVDVSPRFIEEAGPETAAAGLENVSFFVADVQTDDLGGPYDRVFSRFGTMFFDNPVAAMRQIREALVPGGRLVMVVWRIREDNVWLHRAQQAVEAIVQRPEEYDEPTCGPGPFSMAGADTTSGILVAAGFDGITLHRVDQPMSIGADLDEAVDLVLSIGPAGEILRLLGDRADDRREEIHAAVRGSLAEFAGPDGASAPASTWVVSATRPAGD